MSTQSSRLRPQTRERPRATTGFPSSGPASDPPTTWATSAFPGGSARPRALGRSRFFVKPSPHDRRAKLSRSFRLPPDPCLHPAVKFPAHADGKLARNCSARPAEERGVHPFELGSTLRQVPPDAIDGEDQSLQRVRAGSGVPNRGAREALYQDRTFPIAAARPAGKSDRHADGASGRSREGEGSGRDYLTRLHRANLSRMMRPGFHAFHH